MNVLLEYIHSIKIVREWYALKFQMAITIPSFSIVHLSLYIIYTYNN